MAEPTSPMSWNWYDTAGLTVRMPGEVTKTSPTLRPSPSTALPNSASSTEWQARSACIGQTHLFFSPHTCSETCPEKCTEGRRETGRFQRVRQAKMLCNGGLDGEDLIPPCPVLRECRDWSLAVGFPHGIIGGLSEKERKEEIRRADQIRRRAARRQ